MRFEREFLRYYNEKVLKDFKDLAHDVQKKNGIFFNNVSFLYQALAVRGSRFPSLCFERLEYLGDSILQALTGWFLFENYPSFSPEKLTRIRSLLVRNYNLYLLGKKMGLGKIGLILEMGYLNEKQIADMFEAFVGALFLDRKDISLVKEDLMRIFDLESKIEEINNSPWGDKDPKSFLNEFLQKFKPNVFLEYSRTNLGTSNSPRFQVTLFVKEKGTNEIIDSVVGGISRKLREAEKMAAENLLFKWFGISPEKNL